MKDKTYDDYLKEVSEYWFLIEVIPDDFKTYELCMVSLNQNGRALEYIPKNIVTKEMFTIAVSQNYRALEYVPEEFRTIELCMIALYNFILRGIDDFKMYLIPDNIRRQVIYKVNLALC